MVLLDGGRDMPYEHIVLEKTRGGEVIMERAPRTPHGPAVTIAVTADHLMEAKRRNSGHCMTADAIKETLPGVKRISVDLQTIRFTDPERPLRYTYLTPRAVQMALVRFDRGDKTLGPFSFRLQGAHVTLTPTGRRLLGQKMPPVQRTEKQTQAGKVNIQKAIAVMKGNLDIGVLKNTRMGTPESQGKGGNSVPRRVGGKPPPMVSAPSLRREFGLRLYVK